MGVGTETNMEESVEVGDWVSFLQLGVPVIGQVLYIHVKGGYKSYKSLVTTAGECLASSVLEIRKRNK
jgi:hypothetical protein